MIFCASEYANSSDFLQSGNLQDCQTSPKSYGNVQCAQLGYSAVRGVRGRAHNAAA